MFKDFRFKPVIMMWILILLAGCAGIGPGSVERDRFDYVNALSSSWKKQILLNLVKIRYLDAPVFLDVTSVISQYAVEGKIDLGASWNDPILVTVKCWEAAVNIPTVPPSPIVLSREISFLEA